MLGSFSYSSFLVAVALFFTSQVVFNILSVEAGARLCSFLIVLSVHFFPLQNYIMPIHVCAVDFFYFPCLQAFIFLFGIIMQKLFLPSGCRCSKQTDVISVCCLFSYLQHKHCGLRGAVSSYLVQLLARANFC